MAFVSAPGAEVGRIRRLDFGSLAVDENDSSCSFVWTCLVRAAATVSVAAVAALVATTCFASASSSFCFLIGSANFCCSPSAACNLFVSLVLRRPDNCSSSLASAAW